MKDSSSQNPEGNDYSGPNEDNGEAGNSHIVEPFVVSGMQICFQYKSLGAIEVGPKNQLDFLPQLTLSGESEGSSSLARLKLCLRDGLDREIVTGLLDHDETVTLYNFFVSRFSADYRLNLDQYSIRTRHGMRIMWNPNSHLASDFHLEFREASPWAMIPNSSWCDFLSLLCVFNAFAEDLFED